MHDKRRLLSSGESDQPIVRGYPSFFPPVCSVFVYFIPPTARTTPLRQMYLGSLTCAHIWVRAVHTKGGQRHKEVCTSDFNFGIGPNGECPCNRGQMTPDHILQTCPNYNHLRARTWPTDATLQTKLCGCPEDLVKLLPSSKRLAW